MVFCYASLGLLSSIIGVMAARMGKKGDPTMALNMSTYITTGIFAVLTAGATIVFQFDWRIWGATAIGLFVGVIIGITSDYFTNDNKNLYVMLQRPLSQDLHSPFFPVFPMVFFKCTACYGGNRYLRHDFL